MDKYIELIKKFVNRNIDAKKFEDIFPNMFQKEQFEMPEDEHLISDLLFADVDAFCFDSKLFGKGNFTAAD